MVVSLHTNQNPHSEGSVSHFNQSEHVGSDSAGQSLYVFPISCAQSKHIAKGASRSDQSQHLFSFILYQSQLAFRKAGMQITNHNRPFLGRVVPADQSERSWCRCLASACVALTVISWFSVRTHRALLLCLAVSPRSFASLIYLLQRLSRVNFSFFFACVKRPVTAMDILRRIYFQEVIERYGEENGESFRQERIFSSLALTHLLG